MRLAVRRRRRGLGALSFHVFDAKAQGAGGGGHLHLFTGAALQERLSDGRLERDAPAGGVDFARTDQCVPRLAAGGEIAQNDRTTDLDCVAGCGAVVNDDRALQLRLERPDTALDVRLVVASSVQGRVLSKVLVLPRPLEVLYDLRPLGL